MLVTVSIKRGTDKENVINTLKNEVLSFARKEKWTQPETVILRETEVPLWLICGSLVSYRNRKNVCYRGGGMLHIPKQIIYIETM